MHRYKMARWRRILSRNENRRRQIRSIRRLRHSQSGVARIYSAAILTIAWLVLPLLPGCGADPTKTTASQKGTARTVEPPTTIPSSPDTPSPVSRAGAVPDRVIHFRGVDNKYRGSTRILPNDKVIHQREQND